MNSIIRSANYFHEFYVSTYEVLSEVSSFVWNRTPETLPECASRGFRRVISCIRERGSILVRNMVRRVYQTTRRSLHQPVLENLMPQNEDVFVSRLQGNPLMVSSYRSGLEGLGRAAAGWLINESTSPLPPAYNPAVLIASQVRECMAAPLGRFSANALTLTSACYLASKIFPHRQGAVVALAAAAVLSCEYFQLNPLSNYAEAAFGKVGYDLAFYSIFLIGNYLGMWLAGSSERLPNYVRNMTFSTLSYHASLSALEAYGAGSVTSTAVPFLISSIAYNASSKYSKKS